MKTRDVVYRKQIVYTARAPSFGDPVVHQTERGFAILGVKCVVVSCGIVSIVIINQGLTMPLELLVFRFYFAPIIF